jgi:hypothetical protein
VTYTIRNSTFVCSWRYLAKVKVILRPTVSRPVYLGVRHSSGTSDQIFLSFFCIDKWGFRAVGCPLWREDGSVIYCTIASGPCQRNHFGVEVPQNSDHILLSHLKLPPTWRARSLYLYPPGTRWPSYTPGQWVTFNQHRTEAVKGKE